MYLCTYVLLIKSVVNRTYALLIKSVVNRTYVLLIKSIVNCTYVLLIKSVVNRTYVLLIKSVVNRIYGLLIKSVVNRTYVLLIKSVVNPLPSGMWGVNIFFILFDAYKPIHSQIHASSLRLTWYSSSPLARATSSRPLARTSCCWLHKLIDPPAP